MRLHEIKHVVAGYNPNVDCGLPLRESW